MKKIVRYAVLTLAFPFMVIGGIVRFVSEAMACGGDHVDDTLNRLAEWIER